RRPPLAPARRALPRVFCLRAAARVTGDDVRAMERASAVAALLITREEAVTAVESKYRGDFLRDVFLGRAGEEDDVVEHAAAFGWDLVRPLVVVAAEIDPPTPGEGPGPPAQPRQWQERFSAAWRTVTADIDATAPSVDFSS